MMHSKCNVPGNVYCLLCIIYFGFVSLFGVELFLGWLPTDARRVVSTENNAKLPNIVRNLTSQACILQTNGKSSQCMCS